MFKPYGLDMGTVEQKFSALKDNIKLIFFARESECVHCGEARRLFERLASITQKIEFEAYNFAINAEKAKEYGVFAVPSLAIIGAKDYGVRYYGYPKGMELLNFIDDLVYISRGENLLSQSANDHLRQVQKNIQLKLFFSASCPHSMIAAKLALKLAVASERVRVDLIDALEFLDTAEKYHVRGIPLTVVNEKQSFYGALDDDEYITNILNLS